ncbi:MAG: hypothetical protein N2202_09025 [Proteobacteria bacterium]|nr:hypothetical protein [Pseudomonadota bacterium]
MKGDIVTKFILFILLVLLLIPFRNAYGEKEDDRKMIDMGSYSVESLPNENWKVEIEKEKGIIRFIKEEKEKIFGFLPSRKKRLTFIQISKNLVMDMNIWHLSEEKIADDYRNNEEQIMIEMGVKTGQIVLKDVKKGVTQIGDKKLYFMSYKAVSIKQPKIVQEAVLYLYFPQDFKDTNTFYIFLINEGYPLDSPIKVDFTEYYPLLKSFKAKLLSKEDTISPGITPFEFGKRLEIYERIDKISNALLRSKIYKVIKENTTETFKNYPILQLVDRNGDGKPDEFLYFTKKREKTQELGFIYDLNRDGKIDYIVFNGGPMFTKEFTFYWMNYHWIDSNYDGKIDILVYNDIDLDGDKFIDEGITAWIYDKDFDGSTDEGEYLGKKIKKVIEKKDGFLLIKRVGDETKLKMYEMEIFSFPNMILKDINSMLP